MPTLNQLIRQASVVMYISSCHLIISIFHSLSSIPFVKKQTIKKQELLFGKFLLILLLSKASVELGYFFMEDLNAAISQFSSSFSGGGGNAMPPLPDPAGNDRILAVAAGTSDGPLEIPEEGVNQQEIWDNLASQEREARAREHARIYNSVDGIMGACEKEEAAMIEKAHILLEQKGIILEDPTDVTRALGLALYDAWEQNIDHRLPHFRKLKRYLGTTRCSIWNTFIDELRELGNPQVNSRHKVD